MPIPNFARSERKFTHKGVAAHPGDKGMKALADAIVEDAFHPRHYFAAGGKLEFDEFAAQDRQGIIGEMPRQ